MSRKQRILRKRFAVFCEGDTEYNYIDKMRKNQGVELVLKPINMHGGGYSNFLRRIKTEAQSNFLAKFIIVDADRIKNNSWEKGNFMHLLEYCMMQNEKYSTPHFLIVNNPNFEYVACLHSSEYSGQDIQKYITAKFGVKDIDSMKSNEDIYDFLNSGAMSYEIMLDKIKDKESFLENKYEIEKTTFDICIKDTLVNFDLLSRKCSNINEFFDVIDW